jgi:hypothetical protein
MDLFGEDEIVEGDAESVRGPFSIVDDAYRIVTDVESEIQRVVGMW